MKRKLLSGARGFWLRKPETQVVPNARAYKRKGRRRGEKHIEPKE